MEALALMLIHLLTPGGLSWTRNGVPKTEEAHDILKREKAGARPEDLCRGLPNEFEDFLRYCRRLRFAECPDYSDWYERFQQLAIDENFPASDDLIWPPPKPVVCTSRVEPPALLTGIFCSATLMPLRSLGPRRILMLTG